MAAIIEAPNPKDVAETCSIFEIDQELDGLFDKMQQELDGNGEISAESRDQFELYCAAFGEKVDRIGRFIRVQEAVARFSKEESERLAARAKTAESKVAQTKEMLLFFMQARNLTKLEGKAFTFRQQKNGQDSVRVVNEEAIPMAYKRIEARIDGALWELLVQRVPADHRLDLINCVKGSSVLNDAIKAAAARSEHVPGAEVYRGNHVRVA